MEDCMQKSQNGGYYESCKADIEKTNETTEKEWRHQQQNGEELVINRDGNGFVSNPERIAVIDVDPLQHSVDDSQKNEIPNDRHAEKTETGQNGAS